jgi:hypothetical protein
MTSALVRQGLVAAFQAGTTAGMVASQDPVRAYRLDQSWKLRGPQIRVRGSSVKS